MLSTPIAFGQTTLPLDQNKCAIFLSNQVITPFIVTVEHDSALVKSITPAHNDPASALQMQGADPTKQEQKNINPKTHLTFGSNDTDNWQVILQLVHAPTDSNNHTITSNLFTSQQQLLQTSQKLSYTGTTFCIIYKLASTPPVHIMSEQEVIATAEKVQEAKYQEFNANIAKYANQASSAGNSAGFIGVVMVLLTLMNFVSNKLAKDKSKTLEENLKIAQANFKESVSIQNVLGDARDMRFNDQVRTMKENFILVATEVLNSQKRAEMLTYNAISDFYILLQTKANELGLKSFKVAVPEKPKEADISQLVESIVNPKIETPEKQQQAQSKIPIVGKVIDKFTLPKDIPDKVKFWYDEYKKGIDEKYKNQLPKIWDENKVEADKDPKSDARAKCEAILLMIKENDNKWP